QSVSPVAVDVQFYSPWAYRCAILLASFDRLVLACMTARKVGLFFEDDWRESVVDSASRVRSCFHGSQLFRHTGVTRDDMAANNAIARRAVETYEKLPGAKLIPLPEDVLRGERR